MNKELIRQELHNCKFKAIERYSFGVVDSRAIYGSSASKPIKKTIGKRIKEWLMLFRVKRFLKGYAANGSSIDNKKFLSGKVSMKDKDSTVRKKGV